MKVQFIWGQPDIRTIIGLVIEEWDEYDEETDDYVARKGLIIGFMIFEILISTQSEQIN